MKPSNRKFHFISGLPRAGSTLLAAILNQNPRFRAGMTSPLADIMGVVMAEASSKNDFSFDVTDEQRVAILRGLVLFYLVCSVGLLANVGVAFSVYDQEPIWWLAGAAGALMGVVWNYAMSGLFVWRKR